MNVTMSVRGMVLAAATALAACASPAWAQLARNSDAPVDMTADELEVQNAQCVSIWRGQAEALQDDARLRADVLRTFFQVQGGGGANGPACGQLNRIEAQGNVYYVTPQQRIRGDAAVYEAGGETITVTGDVVAALGKNVLRGQRLVVNVRTGQSQMFTAAKGRTSPARVRGVFYPKQQPQGPGGR